MTPDTVAVVGTILAAALGGGTLTGLFTYFRDRRRDRGEHVIGTIGSLERLNDRLTAQVADLQTRLDEERQLRRSLEDDVAQERRERRALEERIAALERQKGGIDG